MAGGVRSLRKQCRICGEDCSDRPRVKDQYGHYYCQDCAAAHMRPGVERKQQERSHESAAIDHDDLHAELIEEVRRAAGVEDEPGEPGDIQTEARGAVEDVDEDIIPLAPEDVTEDERVRTCPVCFHKYAPDSGICASCGFDEKKGIQSSRFVESSRAPAAKRERKTPSRYSCPSCGYDMSSCPTLKCPECGQTRPSRSTLDRRELSRQTDREAYRVPAIQLAAGFGLMLIFGLIGSGWPMLIAAPVLLTVQAGAGLLAYYACCILWMGFDAPLKLNALRLASIYAVTIAVSFFFDLVPIPVIGWVLPLLVYVSMFMNQMEADWVDAVAVLILTVILGSVIMFFLPMFFAAIGLTL